MNAVRGIVHFICKKNIVCSTVSCDNSVKCLKYRYDMLTYIIAQDWGKENVRIHTLSSPLSSTRGESQAAIYLVKSFWKILTRNQFPSQVPPEKLHKDKEPVPYTSPSRKASQGQGTIPLVKSLRRSFTRTRSHSPSQVPPEKPHTEPVP